MKRLRMVVLAGLVAVGAISATVGSAEAGGYWTGGAAFTSGPGFSLNLGFASPVYPSYRAYPGYPLYPPNYGYVLAPPPPPLPVYPAYPMTATEAHMEWCVARYRSYNPATDTFIGYDGLAHRCAAPY